MAHNELCIVRTHSNETNETARSNGNLTHNWQSTATAAARGRCAAAAGDGSRDRRREGRVRAVVRRDVARRGAVGAHCAVIVRKRRRRTATSALTILAIVAKPVDLVVVRHRPSLIPYDSAAAAARRAGIGDAAVAR